MSAGTLSADFTRYGVPGIDDKIYAIDVEAGQVIWKKHFEYPTPARRGQPGDPLCPTGLTATPVIGPPNAAGHRTVYTGCL